jgi:hypothetical protein
MPCKPFLTADLMLAVICLQHLWTRVRSIPLSSFFYYKNILFVEVHNLKSKQTFGILTILLCLFIIIIFIFTNPFTWQRAHFFIDETGEERIDAVFELIEQGDNFIVFNRINDSDMNYLLDRICDSPDLFWVDIKYTTVSVGKISMVFLRNKYDGINSKRAEIDIMSSAVINTIIKDDMTEYDKVLAIHDWICENITYGQADDNSDQDIYGALIMKKARCAGYAEVFTYLLSKVGVQSKVISGNAIDKNGMGVDHAWNIVYIDGQPYYFDITWDDDGPYGHTYNWFGMTSKEFQLSHFPNDGYEWVEANSTDACYYIKNNMYIEKYTPSAIANQIKKQGKTLYIKCANRKTLNDLIHAIENEDEIRKIMKAAGIPVVGTVSYVKTESASCVKLQIQ